MTTATFRFGAAWSAGPMLRRFLDERRLAAACADSRSVVLTYDDGPTRPATDRILDLLREESAPATFFVLGARAEKDPDLVDKVKSHGHEIGCHSYAHHNAWDTTSREAVTDIEKGYEALAQWISPSDLFRPPYGKVTMATSRAIRRRRASMGWWTIVAGDNEAPLSDPHRVVTEMLDRNGGVVLMHDGHPVHPLTEKRIAYVLETTLLLIRAARSQGLRLRRLSEVM